MMFLKNLTAISEKPPSFFFVILCPPPNISPTISSSTTHITPMHKTPYGKKMMVLSRFPYLTKKPCIALPSGVFFRVNSPPQKKPYLSLYAARHVYFRAYLSQSLVIRSTQYRGGDVRTVTSSSTRKQNLVVEAGFSQVVSRTKNSSCLLFFGSGIPNQAAPPVDIGSDRQVRFEYALPTRKHLGHVLQPEERIGGYQQILESVLTTRARSDCNHPCTHLESALALQDPKN